MTQQHRLPTPAVGLLVLPVGSISFTARLLPSPCRPFRRICIFRPAEAGLLLSAFAWSYAVAQLPASSLVHRGDAAAPSKRGSCNRDAGTGLMHLTQPKISWNGIYRCVNFIA